jgi:hypothetical protein
MLVLWAVNPCGLVGMYCLQGWREDGGSMFLRNVGIYPQVQTVLQPRRTSSTSSPPWEYQIWFSTCLTEHKPSTSQINIHSCAVALHGMVWGCMQKEGEVVKVKMGPLSQWNYASKNKNTLAKHDFNLILVNVGPLLLNCSLIISNFCS